MKRTLTLIGWNAGIFKILRLIQKKWQTKICVFVLNKTFHGYNNDVTKSEKIKMCKTRYGEILKTTQKLSECEYRKRLTTTLCIVIPIL